MTNYMYGIEPKVSKGHWWVWPFVWSAFLLSIASSPVKAQDGSWSSSETLHGTRAQEIVSLSHSFTISFSCIVIVTACEWIMLWDSVATHLSLSHSTWLPRLLLTMVLYRVHLVLRTAVRLRTVVARFPMSRIVDRDPGTHTIIIVSTIQVFPPNWPSLTPARWSKYHKINYYNMLATYNKNIVTHCECFTWCTVDFQGTIQSWSDFSGKWRYTHSAIFHVNSKPWW